MSQAEALYHLQTIEISIINNRKRLQEIQVSLEDNEQVQTATQQVTQIEKEIVPLRTKVKDLELQIQTTTTKAQAAEDRLYSGTIKNPKELQDVQNEIASLKRRHADLENRLLEGMVELDEKEDRLNQANDNLQAIQQAWGSEHQDLLAEQTTLQEEITTLKQTRKNALQDVSEKALETYNMLRPKKANRPMAIMQSRSCSICGVEQTMKIEQEVRKGEELVSCSSCGRILVYKR